jgi:hypothetical protein
VTEPVLYMFAPVHKRAFGVAVGLWAALGVFVLTAVVLLRPEQPAPDLILLTQYFAGYSVSWHGAVVGGCWAGLVGFTAGWFLALCRNFAVGLTILTLRARSELGQTHDFLDHI